MSAGTIFLYAVVGVFLLFYLRRLYLRLTVRQYTPTQLAERIDSGEVVLLDVRTAKERSASTIHGSIHIPINDLLRDREKLEKHKSKEIVCFCQTGSRSLVAAARLKKLGFKVGHLSGGMGEWNFYYK
jgi:rhodanese-related sulfurtransferase